MTGGTASQGVFTQLLLEPGASPHPFDANSEIYEYLRHSIRKHGRIIGGNGIRGTRSRFKVRHREGCSFFYGDLDMYVSPGELATLLIHMIGNNASGTTFSLAEDVPYFGLLVDTDYNTFEFKDCKIDKWVIRSSAPQFRAEDEPDMLYLTLSIIASDCVKGTAWPGTPPTLGTTGGFEPYVISDCDGAVTLSGSTREIEEFVIAGDNFIYAKYVNSLKPQSLVPRDRLIAMVTRVPWVSANNALYGQDPDGAAASIVFTNGTVSTTLNFANMHVRDHTPAPERGKEQVDLLLDGICTATGTTNSTRELQIINDSTV